MPEVTFMRIMTFNVQHFLDYKNKKIDFDLFADFIKKLNIDVCGLNEVRGNGPLKGYTDQLNTVADKLGYERYFGEAIKVHGKNPYGNGIIAKKAFSTVQTIKIPDPKIKLPWHRYESRCIIRAQTDSDGKKVLFFVCHMGLAEAERKNAVKTLCRLLDETDAPAIVMGDFNATPDKKVLAPLFKRLTDTDIIAETKNLPTFPSDNPEIKIDYMLYRGLRCDNVQTVNEVVSDHLPIIAEFSII